MMGHSFKGTLDIFRSALIAYSEALHDPESVDVVEQVLLSECGPGDSQVSGHFRMFKEFLSAIDRSYSSATATHTLFFKWSTFLERFKDAADRNPKFSLLDFSDEAVESRLRLAEVAPYLSRSLIASAIDHSANAVWRILHDLLPPQPQTDAVHILLNLRNKDTSLLSHPIFTLGDLIGLDSEAAHV